MRTRRLAALIFLLVFLLTGCGTKTTDSSAAPPSAEDTAATQAIDTTAAQTSDTTVTSVASTTSPSADDAPPQSETHTSAPHNDAPAILPHAENVVSPDGYVDSVKLKSDGSENETAVIFGAKQPALPDILEPTAPGKLTEENSKAIIDYSNTKDGYVMVKFTAETQKRLKTQVKGPSTTYTYTLYPGQWTVFPLTDGNGKYQIKVFENTTGNKYSLVLAASQDVELTDEFAPFLRPNQYVNYDISSLTVIKAQELCGHIDKPLEKVKAIYTYVVTTLSYDKEKAAAVKSGYLPELDTVLAESKGICFDYAALMTGMLRSQGVPCKMVFGYAGTAYHAWISVWTEEEGWVDGAIFFDGTTWHRLDPTFASSAGQSAEILKYIGDGSNYTEKYFY